MRGLHIQHIQYAVRLTLFIYVFKSIPVITSSQFKNVLVILALCLLCVIRSMTQIRMFPFMPELGGGVS